MRPLLAAVAVLLLLPAGAAAQDDPVLPPGARAAGIELGGQTVSQAAAMLDGAFSATLAQPMEFRVAGHRKRLDPASIGFTFDPLRSARRAYNAAIAAGGPADVPLHVTYDGEKLAAFTVALDRASDIRPRSAKLKMTIRRMKVRRARMGWSIDEKALALSLDPLLADPWALRVVRVERERVHPKRNVIDLRREHRAVLTIDRANFKLRYFKNLKLKRSVRDRRRRARLRDAHRSLLDPQQGGRPGLERARRAVGRRLPQRGRRGRLGGEPSQGPLDGYRRRRGHPWHRGRGLDRHRRVPRLHPDASGGRHRPLSPRAGRHGRADPLTWPSPRARC